MKPRACPSAAPWSRSAPIEVGGQAGVRVGGDLSLASGGRLHAAGNTSGAISVGGNLVINAAQLAVDRDLLAPLTVNGHASIIRGGSLTVGRDFTGGLTVSVTSCCPRAACFPSVATWATSRSRATSTPRAAC